MQWLRKGDSGDAVRFLQERLNAKGFHVVADGDFGKKTDTAVRQFQASCNLKADGWVGDQTWERLMVEGRAKTPAELVDQQRAELELLAVSVVDPTSVAADDRLAVLLAGIAELGKQERPVGSNGGPEIAHIVEPMDGDGIMPSDYCEHWGWAEPAGKLPPWCGIFVSYCLLTGLMVPFWDDIPFGDWFGGAQQIEDWGKSESRFSVARASSVVIPGTIFTMGRGSSSSDAGGSSARAGHVGLVVADDNERVITIEGNVSNGVRSLKRRKSGLRGFTTWW